MVNVRESRRLEKLIQSKRTFNYLIGQNASEYGVKQTMAHLNAKIDKVKYWKRKYEDPNYKTGSCGGARHCFDDFTMTRIIAIMKTTLETSAISTYKVYKKNILDQLGINVSNTFVRSVLIEAGYTWKVPSTKQINKYKDSNMAKYDVYLEWIRTQDPRKVKFLDECHFAPRDYVPRKALSKRGKPAVLLRPGSIPKTCSITLVTSLNTPDCLFGINTREETNTQRDFFNCLIDMVETQVLIPGDFLVMDNAAVHTGTTLETEIYDYLTNAGITPVALPTYSPELNPCELVFARVKYYIKSFDAIQRDEQGREVVKPFEQLLGESLASISSQELLSMYQHCRYPKAR